MSKTDIDILIAPRHKVPQDRAGLAIEFVELFGTMLCWILLFSAGIFVDSAPHRDAITEANRGIADQGFHWIVAIVSYTFTNVALLSILSAVLGAAARRLEHIARGRSPQRVPLPHPYAAAALRGFFVYLMAVSGLIIMVEGLFTTIAISADAYIRISGAISMVSFLIGFSPELFARILNRIATLLEEHAEQARPVRNGPGD